MSLELRIIQPSEISSLRDYELRKLNESIPNSMDRELHSWNAKWRQESLEHFIPQGWSFLAIDSIQGIAGYFLAQPLLFFDGQTQSLWSSIFSQALFRLEIV